MARHSAVVARAVRRVVPGQDVSIAIARFSGVALRKAERGPDPDVRASPNPGHDRGRRDDPEAHVSSGELSAVLRHDIRARSDVRPVRAVYRAGGPEVRSPLSELALFSHPRLAPI